MLYEVWFNIWRVKWVFVDVNISLLKRFVIIVVEVVLIGVFLCFRNIVWKCIMILINICYKIVFYEEI